jgi:RimJ/RimL family protein N-acetyltransferase
VSNLEDENSAQPASCRLNIVGKLVALGPYVRDDLALYHRWINDFEVTRYFLDTLRPQTPEERAAWYERMSASDPYTINFAIYELAALRPIGRVWLADISYHHRRASFGILIGEKDCWGKGYGTEATRLALDYGFHLLGLHNIMLSVSSANTAAIRAYTRAGFQVIGARREYRREGDHTLDNIFMDCLSTEFEVSTVEPSSPVEPERASATPRLKAGACESPDADQSPGVTPGAVGEEC